MLHDVYLVLKKVDFWKFSFLLVSGICTVCVAPLITVSGSFTVGLMMMTGSIMVTGLIGILVAALKLGTVIRNRTVEAVDGAHPPIGYSPVQQGPRQVQDITITAMIPMPENSAKTRPQSAGQPRSPQLGYLLTDLQLNVLMRLYAKNNGLDRIVRLQKDGKEDRIRDTEYTKATLPDLKISFLSFCPVYSIGGDYRQSSEKISKAIVTALPLVTPNRAFSQVIQTARLYMEQKGFEDEDGMTGLTALVAQLKEKRERMLNAESVTHELLMTPLNIAGNHWQLVVWLLTKEAGRVQARIMLTNSMAGDGQKILEDLAAVTERAGIPISREVSSQAARHLIYRQMPTQEGMTCGDHMLWAFNFILMNLPTKLPAVGRALTDAIDNNTVPATQAGVGSLGLFSKRRNMRMEALQSTFDFSQNLRLKHFHMLADDKMRREGYGFQQEAFLAYQEGLFPTAPARRALTPAAPATVTIPSAPLVRTNTAPSDKLQAVTEEQNLRAQTFAQLRAFQAELEKRIGKNKKTAVVSSKADDGTFIPPKVHEKPY